jgi:hypothetical protein
MKTIFKTLAVLSLLVTVSLAWAEVYKWVDDKGNVHFTEDPSTIPEKYQEGTKTREFSETPQKRAPSSNRDSKYDYPPSQRQTSVSRQVNKDSQDCGSPGEPTIVVFLTRYCGGARTDIGRKCREILKECCNYSDTEFAGLVDKGAKDAKWNVIPEKILGLLSRYCGQTEPTIAFESSATSEEELPKSPKKNRGAINTQTGEYYPPSGNGIINPRTGDFYPKSGNGFINPKNGDYYPAN